VLSVKSVISHPPYAPARFANVTVSVCFLEVGWRITDFTDFTYCLSSPSAAAMRSRSGSAALA
jgi:hypothetical protein